MAENDKPVEDDHSSRTATESTVDPSVWSRDLEGISASSSSKQDDSHTKDGAPKLRNLDELPTTFPKLYWDEKSKSVINSDKAFSDAVREQSKVSDGSNSKSVFLEMGNTANLYGGASKEGSDKNAGSAEKASKSGGKIKVSTDGFLDFVEKNFDKFDKDHDGVISEREAEAQVENPEHKGADAVYVTALNRRVKDIGTKDPYEQANSDGLSKEEFKDFAEQVRGEKNSEQRKENTGISDLREDFKKLDKNEDGSLSKDELKDAIKNGNFSKEKLESLKKVLESFDKVKQNSDESLPRNAGGGSLSPGIPDPDGKFERELSRDDLSDSTSYSENVANALESNLKAGAERLQERESALAKGKEPPISQGATEDCFLIAPLKELEKRDPGAIDKMVQDNKDGTMTVTFPGSKEAITVKAPTEAELASYANNRNAAAIEKAYAQIHKHPAGDNAVAFESLIPQEHYEDGGRAKDAIEAITGSKTEEITNNGDNAKELIDAVKAATKDGDMVIAGTKHNTSSDTGIQQRHAYGVSYNPENGNLIFKNPYPAGSDNHMLEPTNADGTAKDGKMDGQFEVTPEQAKEVLAVVTIEKRA